MEEKIEEEEEEEKKEKKTKLNGLPTKRKKSLNIYMKL